MFASGTFAWQEAVIVLRTRRAPPGSYLAPDGRSGSTSNPGSVEETRSPYDLHDIWLA